jgi:phage shock protein PspC (stress-responsive transcriptional regulator)
MSDASMPQVEEKKPNLMLRSDTFLGVCEGLGEDFGFNPIWLRVAFSAALLWNPYAIIGAYLGLGILVAISRLAFPKPAVAEAAARAPAQCPLVEDAPAAADAPQAGRERELVAA